MFSTQLVISVEEDDNHSASISVVCIRRVFSVSFSSKSSMSFSVIGSNEGREVPNNVEINLAEDLLFILKYREGNFLYNDCLRNLIVLISCLVKISSPVEPGGTKRESVKVLTSLSVSLVSSDIVTSVVLSSNIGFRIF